MSIIIRLQNLPWSANALDIRQYFSGLQIPEGGVHIVGGELGDAFIAFSTDEDARQAFLRTDGKIKGIQIKLMLSSRTEMQRVIEQARTQSMAAFMLPTTQPTPAPLPAAVPPMMPASVPRMMPASVPPVPAAVPEIQRETRDQDDDYYGKRKDRRRSRSKSRDRRDKSRERRDRRYRDRSRSKSRDRRDRRRGRDRSRSRNRSRDRNRRDRGRSDDRRDGKDTIPFQRDVKKPVPEIWSNPPHQVGLNIIPPTYIKNNQPPPWNAAKNNLPPNGPIGFQARGINNGLPGPRGPQFGANPINPVGAGAPQIRSRESWPSANPPSVREQLNRSPTDYPTPPMIGYARISQFKIDRRVSMPDNFNDIPAPTMDKQDEEHDSLQDRRFSLEDTRGRADNFRGPVIEENSKSPRNDFRGPKNDFRGPRDFRNDKIEPRPDLHFSRDSRFSREGPAPNDNIRSDLNNRRPRPFDAPNPRENGKKTRLDNFEPPLEACIALEPFYGSYGDLRRLFQGLSINYKGIKIINDEYGHKTGVCFVQFRDVSNKTQALNLNGTMLNNTTIRIKHITDQAFQEAIDRYNPAMDQLNPQENYLVRNRNTKKFLSNEPDIKDFECLKIEDLPNFVKEQDILHIFSQHPLISLHLNVKPKGGTVAYVKFSSKEVARFALGESSHHVIRNKPVTVKPCTNEEFNEENSQGEVFDEPKQPDSLTDCLSLSNLPIKTNNRDISDFFSDIGLIPLKIHLISDDAGFTGNAYCEFESSEEAGRGASKNNTLIGPNTIRVQPIQRQEMESILGNTLPHPNIEPGKPLIVPAAVSLKKEESSPAVIQPVPKVRKSRFSNDTVTVPEIVQASISPISKDTPIPTITKDNPKSEDDNQASVAQPETVSPKPDTLGSPKPPDEQANSETKEDTILKTEEEKESTENVEDDREIVEENNDTNGRRFDNFGKTDRRNKFQSDRLHYVAPHQRGNFEGPSRGGRRNFEPRRFGPRGGGVPDLRFEEPHHRTDSPDEEDVRPGCTVYMDNVPYKAGTNEILDFFEGYNSTNNVARRYNPNNTPSPEARVTFYHPADANRAVRELHGTKIWGRSIFLRQE